MASRNIPKPTLKGRHVALVALFFGGSQALLPLLGWLIGARMGPAVQAWDHWIAFALLAGIGGKMLYEAGAPDGAEPDPSTSRDPFGWRIMAALALTTSVDAFAAGLTLPMLGAPMALSLSTIGLVTAALSVSAPAAGGSAPR